MRFLAHPVVGLVGVAVVMGAGARSLFFRLSRWLWHFAPTLAPAEILPWARWAMVDRDGAEPYALLVLALVHLLMTGLGLWLLARLPARWRAAAGAILLAAVALIAYRLPPKPPLRAIEPRIGVALLVVGVSLLAAALIARSVRRKIGVPVWMAVFLFSLCLIPTTPPILGDLPTVLSPALRLAQGIAPREIYLQYDLLPSLLAVGWGSLGAAPASFSLVCAFGYFAMLVGLYVVARRLFTRSYLAGPLVMSVLLAKLYACVVDPNAYPQVTPLRLDLWPVLLMAVLARGLRHWWVGLALGLLCFFSHSMGILYLGAYALALAADFLARRRGAPGGAPRPALVAELRQAWSETAPALALVTASLLATRLVFGEFEAEGLSIYRHLGVGMLRIERTSFYWWLLPLTGAAGWLAFSRRGSLPARRGEAAILAVALLVANSMYFFGRSHEHNLINTSASFVFCLFLSLDLAWPSSSAAEPRVLRWGFPVLPYLVVAICAYSYSGRVIKKLDVQKGFALEAGHAGGDLAPELDCDEVRHAVGDARVFFLSYDDYWYYQQCGYVPQGYTQPVILNVLRSSLIAELSQVLAAGVAVLVPRNPRDPCAKVWPDLLPGLPRLQRTESPRFYIYQRAPNPSTASHVGRGHAECSGS